MKRADRVEGYLDHILEAIGRATSYVLPLADLEAFRKNPLVQDAVVRNLEIIGEAVGKIQKASPDFTKQHPEIPWTQMRGMRNVAIHEYFFVDLEIVWTTVKHDLPALKRQIDDLRVRHSARNYNWVPRMLKRFALLALLFLAACFMLFGAWRALYPNRNDAKSMQYVLWTKGLYSLDPEVALDTMVGDRYRSKLVLGKSKGQLAARFGFLTPISSASEYDQIAYRDLGLPNSSHEVFALRQSTWLVVFTDGWASDLILVKGN